MVGMRSLNIVTMGMTNEGLRGFWKKQLAMLPSHILTHLNTSKSMWTWIKNHQNMNQNPFFSFDFWMVMIFKSHFLGSIATSYV